MLKETTVALASFLTTQPSEVVVKVCVILVGTAEKHWEAEAKLRNEEASKLPKESAERTKAEQIYTTAFGNWHRLSMLKAVLIKGVTRPTYGTPDQVQQAA